MKEIKCVRSPLFSVKARLPVNRLGDSQLRVSSYLALISLTTQFGGICGIMNDSVLQALVKVTGWC